MLSVSNFVSKNKQKNKATKQARAVRFTVSLPLRCFVFSLTPSPLLAAASIMSNKPPAKKRKTNGLFKGVGAMLIRPQQAACTGATARMLVNPSTDVGRRRGLGITQELLPAPVAVRWMPPLAQGLHATADFKDADPLDDFASAPGDAGADRQGDCGVTVVCCGCRGDKSLEEDGDGSSGHPVSSATGSPHGKLTLCSGGLSGCFPRRQGGVWRRAHEAGGTRGVCVRRVPRMPGR